uniref:Uncharacterized protein n=1 Tax=viral metagenome TaxID=1070528 RepID=A0A2V0RA30_9ZZZZ
MQSTTTNVITTNVPSALVLRPLSPAVRIRNAFMRMGLIFEFVDFNVSDALSAAYTPADMMSPLSDRHRRLLYDLVTSRELFNDVPDLGTRVGTFTINPNSGIVSNRLLSESSRRTLLQAETIWDNMMNDIRSNEYLSEQSDMSEGRFTYRTTAGARFPRIIERSELDLKAREDTSKDATIHTDFSTWKGGLRFQSTELDDSASYSTSAPESSDVYASKRVNIVFPTKKGELPKLNVAHHARRRLIQYGVDSSCITLRSTTVPGFISSGRKIPNRAEEVGAARTGSAGTYKLTVELDDADVSLSSNNVSTCKVVISVHVRPKLGRADVSLTDFFESGNDTLEIVQTPSAFVITIIPKVLASGQPLLRATGMPVIPKYVDIDDVSPSVAIIKTKDPIGADADVVAQTMNEALRSTDQWLNVKHDEVRSFCDTSSHLREMYEKQKFSYVTKNGVEFADVELLQRKYPALFNGLHDIGISMLHYLCAKDNVMDIISHETILKQWPVLFDNISGPSIVHSEEIRSPNLRGYGAKPVTSSLLLVRLVLSRILNVGIGESDHNPLNVNSVLLSHHLVNQKRAEAMLIPLSVLKDNLLVYSLSGQVSNYLKDVSKENLRDTALGKMKAKSFVQIDGKRMPKIDELSINALFSVRAPVLRVTRQSPALSELWFVAPSGLEFDVSPIAMEICHKLSKEMLLSPRDRAVIAWHPLFTILVSRTIAKKGGEDRYDVVLLPAKRKSSIAKSYHNTTDVLRAVDYDSDILSHYARLREGAGYIAALKTHVAYM